MEPLTSRHCLRSAPALLLAVWLVAPSLFAATNDWFVIRVVDQETGRGVPLVELLTVNQISCWTDSGGVVAFQEPGLMNRETFFHVHSPGYEYPKDGFGYRGLKLVPRAGETVTIPLRRTNLAERLYRITGQGLYRDTLLAGGTAPIREPVLNGLVTGQDTVIVTPYHGRLYWFWGDTDRPGYPLGNFGATGATSPLPGPGGPDPEVGINLDYFTGRDGFARAMIPRPDHGLRWIECVMTVPDAQGRERLVARVAHHKDLSPALGWYLMEFDDEAGRFRELEHWDRHDGHDSSHPFRARVGDREYFYLYPNWRVPADLESLRHLGRYEAFTCVDGDGRFAGADTAIDRDAAGHPRYTWKAGADRLHPGRLRELVRAGRLQRDEGWLSLRDIERGTPVEAGRGSVAWNPYRQRWVMIASGRAGEIWFAEADTPTGPWIYARRVADHGDYNFYNPVHHAFLDQDGGRTIYFEGTYTAAFSGAKTKTPRYDYNQILYRLRLDSPRLSLPVPVYRLRSGVTGAAAQLRLGSAVAADRAWDRVEGIAFLALPPDGSGTPGSKTPEGIRSVAVNRVARDGAEALTSGSSRQAVAEGDELFRVLPREGALGEVREGALIGLFEFRRGDGARWYGVADEPVPAGFERVGEPLGRVWRNPLNALPLDPAATPVPIQAPSGPARAVR